jgi:hypothetical protein
VIDKNILDEIANDITDEEIIAITSEEIILEHKDFNLKNFILKMKSLKFNTLPHFKYAKKYAKKNMSKLSAPSLGRLTKLTAQMELTQYLMSQGATIKEIRQQTGIPDDLLAVVIRSSYIKVPKDILRFRLINYRLLKIAKMQEIFFKETIMPMLSKQDSQMARNMLTAFEDLVKMETKERAMLEHKLNEK